MDRAWMRRNWWQIGVLTIAGWTGFYIAFLGPLEYSRSISAQRTSGLGVVAGYDPKMYWAHKLGGSEGEVAWDPNSMWRQMSWRDVFRPRAISYQHGRFRPYAMAGAMTMLYLKADGGDEDARQIVLTTALELEVKSPAESVEKIRALAQRLGGYLVGSETGDDNSAAGGAITIRVPVSRLEEASSEMRKLALRVESEKTDATDVTKEYVDREARLRNLRAQEEQYLGIMKRATTVKDTLDVSAKLSEVRGQIEQQQAEFAALAKQVETAAIAVTLHAEADAKVFGLHWRPLYALKAAARDGVEDLANYVSAMTAAIFRLPTFLLWLGTIVACMVIAWRGTRWMWRTFFAVPQAKS